MSSNKEIPTKCVLEFNILFFLIFHTSDKPVIRNILPTFLLIVMLCNRIFTVVFLTEAIFTNPNSR